MTTNNHKKPPDSMDFVFSIFPNIFYLILLGLLAGGCNRYRQINIFNFTSSDRQIHKYFAQADSQPRVFYFQGETRTMRGMELGADSLPVTLLIHGAPSSMVKFRKLFLDTTLTRHTKLVAVDRPGYGKSGYGQCETSIEKQARCIEPLLHQLSAGGRKVLVLGMSYGGPVAAKLAMDNPERVSGLLLLSASVQPNAEKVPGIAHLVRSPVGAVFPKYARVATQEKFSHTKALEAIQDGWKNINCPVWILHGQADPLIYYSNAVYASEQLAHTEVTVVGVPRAGHNLLIERPKYISRIIQDAVKSITEAETSPYLIYNHNEASLQSSPATVR